MNQTNFKERYTCFSPIKLLSKTRSDNYNSGYTAAKRIKYPLLALNSNGSNFKAFSPDQPTLQATHFKRLHFSTMCSEKSLTQPRLQWLMFFLNVTLYFPTPLLGIHLVLKCDKSNNVMPRVPTREKSKISILA